METARRQYPFFIEITCKDSANQQHSKQDLIFYLFLATSV
jgi:hypothetical protein